MTWYLSPSGWPLWANDGSLFSDRLVARGWAVIDASQVQAAIDAYNNQQPPPEPPGDVIDSVELAEAVGGKADIGHDHDGRYYTGTEIDTALAGKVDPSDPRLSDDRPATDASVAALVDAPDSATAERLRAAFVSRGELVATAGDPSYGIAGDWNPATGTGTDDSAAFQAALDSLPPGGVLFVPAGHYKVNGLVLRGGRRLVGAGWQSWRDAADSFGAAGYLDPATFNGAVLYSPATAATPAITFSTVPVLPGDTAGTTQGGIENLAIIGPGTGTASRGVLVGSTTQAVVNPIWRNVFVGNFSTGVEQHNTNEGSFYDLVIRGCTTGMTLANNVNNCAFYMLDIQRCVTGLVDDATCLANGFYNFLGQANTDAVRLNGMSHTFVSPYLELNSGWGFDFVTAKSCSVINPSVQGGTLQKWRLQSGAVLNEFTGLRTNASLFTIANAGTGNFFSGVLVGLTDTGVNTQTRDLNNGRMSVLQVSGKLRMLGVLTPQLVSTTAIADTITPAAAGAGGMIYHSNVARPRWSDGTNWRDAAGAIVT